MSRARSLLQVLILAVLLANCKDNSPGADCSNQNLSVSDGYSISQGRWNLVSVKSGWTSAITQPAKLTELKIDQNNLAVITEQGNEVVRFKLVLRQNYQNLLYSADSLSTINTSLISPSGLFSVCNRQLIFDATGVDGPKFTYERARE
jgi:hypothetical protein